MCSIFITDIFVGSRYAPPMKALVRWAYGKDYVRYGVAKRLLSEAHDHAHAQDHYNAPTRSSNAKNRPRILTPPPRASGSGRIHTPPPGASQSAVLRTPSPRPHRPAHARANLKISMLSRHNLIEPGNSKSRRRQAPTTEDYGGHTDAVDKFLAGGHSGKGSESSLDELLGNLEKELGETVAALPPPLTHFQGSDNQNASPPTPIEISSDEESVASARSPPPPPPAPPAPLPRAPIARSRPKPRARAFEPHSNDPDALFDNTFDQKLDFDGVL